MKTEDEASGFTFVQPRRQTYSLPYGFSSYIFKNKSVDLYKKLIMSCKSFFSKNRILVVKYVQIYINFNFDNKNVTCILTNMEEKKIKIWITDELESHNVTDGTLKLLDFMKILYRFDGKLLSIYKEQITFDEYMRLVSSKKLYHVTMHESIVKNSNDSFVSADTLLKPLYDVKILHW